ncbi:clasp N terminal-domain-containing protein [Entophlyctis helioformis]|nr:clasp N terminal-domain-containing protein [Entophlyctis helioformis]
MPPPLLTTFCAAAISSNLEDRFAALQELHAQADELSLEDIEPHLYDQVVDSVTKAVRSPQAKMAIAGLQLVCPLVGAVVDTSRTVVYHLKVLLPLLVPLLVEKLGDARDRCRELALEGLVELYIAVHRQYALHDMTDRVSAGRHGQSQGHAHDVGVEGGYSSSNPFASMLVYLDKEIRANAFSSKIPRTREQSLMWLMTVAQSLHEFSLKPWMPFLLRLLEDPNEAVRAVSRDGLIRLYNTIPNRAMRTDIRRELGKKQIRQSIVDSITAQLRDDQDQTADVDQPGSASSSPTPAAKPASVEPASTAAKTLDVAPAGVVSGGTAASEPTAIMLAYPRDFEAECSIFSQLFNGRETEENWESRERALQRLRGLVRGDSPRTQGYANGLKAIIEPVSRTLHSLRTALVITCCTAIVDLAAAAPVPLDPHVDTLLINLIKISGSSKKLIVSAAVNAIKVLVYTATLQPKYLAHFAAGLADKSQSVRQVAAECLRVLMERLASNAQNRQLAERTGMVDVAEKCLKKSVQDANGAVRDASRDAAFFLKSGWPERYARLVSLLEAPAQKALARHKQPAPTKLNLPRIQSTAAVVADPFPAAAPARASTVAKTGRSPQSSMARSASLSPGHSAPHSATPSKTQDRVSSPIKQATPGWAVPAMSPSSSQPKPAAMPEESIAAMLKSASPDDQRQGFDSLIQTARDAATAMHDLPWGPDATLVLQQHLMDLYTDPSDGMTLSLMRLENLQVLFDSSLLAQMDTVMPVVTMAARGKVSGIQPLFEKYMHHITMTSDTADLLDHLIGHVNPIAVAGPKFRRPPPSGRGGRLAAAAAGMAGVQRDPATVKATNVLLIAWIESLVADWAASDPLAFESFFGNDPRMRGCLNKFVPLTTGRLALRGAEESLRAILGQLAGSFSAVFGRALDTFDYELAEGVRDILGIADPSAEELEDSDDHGRISMDTEDMSEITPKRNRSSQQQANAGTMDDAVSPRRASLGRGQDADSMRHHGTLHEHAIGGDLSEIESHEPNGSDVDEHGLVSDGDVLNETLPYGFAETSVLLTSTGRSGPSSQAASDSEMQFDDDMDDGMGREDVRGLAATMAAFSDQEDEASEFSRRAGRTRAGGLAAAAATATAMLDEAADRDGLHGDVQGEPFVAMSTPYTPSRQLPSIQPNTNHGTTDAVHVGVSGLVGSVDASHPRHALPPPLGPLQRLVQEHVTPVKPRSMSRHAMDQLLNGTPVQQRQPDELAQMVTQLSAGAATHSTLRRLFRLSRQDAGHPHTLPHWSLHARGLFIALSQIIQNPATDHGLQENCLMLLGEVVGNQGPAFSGLESNLLELLFDCRSDGTGHVSGSADAVLSRAMQALDHHALLAALLGMLAAWRFDDPSDPGRRVRRRVDGRGSGGSGTDYTYKPAPAASALGVLGRLVADRMSAGDDAAGGDGLKWMRDLMAIAADSINSDSAEIRKATIDCLVDVSRVLGDGIWTHVEGVLTHNQCKVLQVYVQRSKRRLVDTHM